MAYLKTAIFCAKFKPKQKSAQHLIRISGGCGVDDNRRSIMTFSDKIPGRSPYPAIPSVASGLCVNNLPLCYS